MQQTKDLSTSPFNACAPSVTAAGAREAALRLALEAAIERMDAVAASIGVENRANGISQATHVRHMAGHLAQHAKKARAALAEAPK